MKLIHIRFNDNYRALVKAGLDAITAKFIAAKLRIKVILEVAISDVGVHLDVVEEGVEKKYVFKFVA